MTPTADDLYQDAMQVCRSGHVITDLAHTYPERRLTHCDRCGAATVDRCATCGSQLPGAVHVPGLSPVGVRRPPRYCAVCGAVFPWTPARQAVAADPLAPLERLLRRLPRVARQLRWRQGERPPFRITDEKDLEDLLRALLPLNFDDVRPEGRTPRYAAGTRVDFLLAPERVAVAVKLVRPPLLAEQIAGQMQEDETYYRVRPGCRTLVVLVYDPEGLLHEPRLLEAAWSVHEDEWNLRAVVAAPEPPHQ
jgi:hypothetical protein